MRLSGKIIRNFNKYAVKLTKVIFFKSNNHTFANRK